MSDDTCKLLEEIQVELAIANKLKAIELRTSGKLVKSHHVLYVDLIVGDLE